MITELNIGRKLLPVMKWIVNRLIEVFNAVYEAPIMRTVTEILEWLGTFVPGKESPDDPNIKDLD